MNCSRFPFQVFSSGFHRITGLMLNGSRKIRFQIIDFVLYFDRLLFSALHRWSISNSCNWS